MAIEPPGRRWAAIPEHAMPLFNGEDLRHRLRTYDRSPFIDLLSEWMLCSPAPGDVVAFARDKPHLYITALKNLAGMSGFAETKNIHVDGTIDITGLSDSQLEDRLLEASRALALRATDEEISDVPVSTDGYSGIDDDAGEPPDGDTVASGGNGDVPGASDGGGVRSEDQQPDSGFGHYPEG